MLHRWKLWLEKAINVLSQDYLFLSIHNYSEYLLYKTLVLILSV